MLCFRHKAVTAGVMETEGVHAAGYKIFCHPSISDQHPHSSGNTIMLQWFARFLDNHRKQTNCRSHSLFTITSIQTAGILDQYIFYLQMSHVINTRELDLIC